MGRYRLKTDAGSVKKNHGIHPFAPTILLIGRMEYQKGPDLLVEAAPQILDKHPDAIFLIVGRGQMTEFLQRRAAQLGVLGSFRFLGFLPHWDFLEKLNSCDIVCVPSRNEPFGMVLLEAWAAGKPVVASNVGGLGENVDHMVNGIKISPDAPSVAKGIIHLLDNPDTMAGLARGGSEKLTKFSWKSSVEKLLGVYREAMGS
jgi:glycosyltransferase involved in cell wall biosynthesis